MLIYFPKIVKQNISILFINIYLYFLTIVLGRMVQFDIKEELNISTKIGSLLNHVPGNLNNLLFVKFSNTDDGSSWFEVDKFSGDIIISKRLDRELLCPGWNPKLFELSDSPVGQFQINKYFKSIQTSTKCMLKFNVNCLTTAFENRYNLKQSNNFGSKLITIFDVHIIIHDINDNSCEFYPSSRQIIYVKEDILIQNYWLPIYVPYDPDDLNILGHTILSDKIQMLSNEKYLIENMFKLKISWNIHTNETKHFKQNNLAPFTLYLELLNPLDFELRQEYQLEIRAGDSLKKHQCKLNLNIKVQDSNDHMPVFLQHYYVFNLTEDTPIGHVVVRLNAEDLDQGENAKILYTIILINSDLNNYFYLNSTSGELRLEKRLNYRLQNKHLIRIQAQNPKHTLNHQILINQNLSTTQIEINVIDINDQIPKIRVYSPTELDQLELIEESQPGLDVAVVDVSDDDTGSNAYVQCSIFYQTISEALKLISIDNDYLNSMKTNRKYKLTLNQRIDRELYSIYNLTIYCHDLGDPPLSSNIKLALRIVDINDHNPIFANSQYSIKIFEDSDPKRMEKNYELIHIYATDLDEGLNGKLKYSLAPDISLTLLNLITINESSGIISTMGNLDREQIKDFSFNVLCTDMGDPPRSTQTNINVEVLDYNDNKPIFSKKIFEFFIHENNPIGTLIGSINVSDFDKDLNAELEIELEQSSNEPRIYILSNSYQTKTSKNIAFGLGNFMKNSQLFHMPDKLNYNNYKKLNEINLKLRIFSYQMDLNKFEKSTYQIDLYIESSLDREHLISRHKNQVLTSIDQDLTALSSLYDIKSNLGRNSMNYSDLVPIILVSIQARDKGQPPLTEKVLIKIHVLDQNDHSPQFVFPDPISENFTRVTVSYQEPYGYKFTEVCIK